MSDPKDPLASWPERERRWRKKLGRIRLGVEPIPEQVEKYRKMTWVLTGVAGGIAAMFFALFTAFRSPWLGLAVATILFGPVIGGAWIGFKTTERRAAAYLREREAVDRLRDAAVSEGVGG